jgi:NAD(P)-dependent dehydrogenase (short-subunit alcohol dehydrogenase family)
MLNLKGKIAVVTGCGSIGSGFGNGRAIATVLARQGATVIGTDINEEAGQNTSEFIKKEGNNCVFFKVNMTEDKEVKKFFDQIKLKKQRLDILVNNVGQSEPGGPVEINTETWQQQFALNLDTSFFCIKYAIPIMEKNNGGSIVNISSVAGIRYVGKPQVAYSASKAALIQMTKTTAVIEAKKNIRLNCVIPGLIHTPLVERLAKKYADGDYESFVNHRHSQVPIGKMGQSWDIANAVLFLASDESKYITGTEIIVDGGLTASTP